MPTTKRVLSLACLAAVAPTAFAQSDTTDPAKTLDAITVTGVADTVRAGIFGERKVQETPFSVLSFTSNLIVDQQSRRLGDVLSNDASTRSVGSANDQTETFQVRGLTLQANEVAFNGLYGLQPIRRSGVAVADRVEIFKGPNAVLNGISPFGSFGGVINVVPKRAGEEPVTDVTLEAATGSSFGGSLDVGRRFGANDAFGARFNGLARNGETGIDDSTNQYGSADLALDYAGGPLRLTLDLGYQQDDYRAAQPGFSIAPGLPVPDAPDGSNNLGQEWVGLVSDDTRFVVGAHYDFVPDWTVSVRYGELVHNEDFKSASSFRINNAAGDFSYRALRQPAEFTTRTGDVGLRGRFATGSVKHELALNATYYNADNRYAFSIFGPSLLSNLYAPVASAPPSFAGTPEEPAPGNERTFKTLALADTLSMLEDDLQLTLGLRRQTIDVTNYVNLSGNAQGVVSGVISQEKTSPVAALLYRISPRWAVYANSSEGLAPGPQAPATAVNVGTVLPPIEARSYEIGTKADYGRFGAGAALFRTTQQIGMLDPTTRVYAADGEAVVSGLELNVFGSPWRSVNLIGGFTLLDAEQVRTAGGVNDGRTAVGVPESLASLYAEWLTPLPGFSLTGRYLYTGEQFVSADNVQSIPSSSRFDVGVKWAFQDLPLVLRATIENVADEAYWASARNGSLTRGGPRTAYLSAQMKF